MSMPKRVAVGLVLWLVFLGCLGFLVLEPQKRAGVLPIVLGVGAMTYLAGEWFRGRRATKPHSVAPRPRRGCPRGRGERA